jgi:hypothetical protein
VIRAFLVTMAEEVRYKVKLLEEGQITVDAPISVFNADKKGYFTLFDNAAAAKGKLNLKWVLRKHLLIFCFLVFSGQEKGHSFHKYVDAAPYTKEHFAVSHHNLV